MGWLYLPDDLKPGERAPAIVMANAVSAIKEITLPGYAERFSAAGFVVLAFDYRHFGASGGQPRNHIVPVRAAAGHPQRDYVAAGAAGGRRR